MDLYNQVQVSIESADNLSILDGKNSNIAYVVQCMGHFVELNTSL